MQLLNQRSIKETGVNRGTSVTHTYFLSVHTHSTPSTVQPASWGDSSSMGNLEQAEPPLVLPAPPWMRRIWDRHCFAVSFLRHRSISYTRKQSFSGTIHKNEILMCQTLPWNSSTVSSTRQDKKAGTTSRQTLLFGRKSKEHSAVHKPPRTAPAQRWPLTRLCSVPGGTAGADMSTGHSLVKNQTWVTARAQAVCWNEICTAGHVWLFFITLIA